MIQVAHAVNTHLQSGKLPMTNLQHTHTYFYLCEVLYRHYPALEPDPEPSLNLNLTVAPTLKTSLKAKMSSLFQ